MTGYSSGRILMRETFSQTSVAESGRLGEQSVGAKQMSEKQKNISLPDYIIRNAKTGEGSSRRRRRRRRPKPRRHRRFPELP